MKRRTKPVISNSILAKIDMRIIGDGEVGPMTKRLSELYAQRTAKEGVQVVELYGPSSAAAKQSKLKTDDDVDAHGELIAFAGVVERARPV